MAWKVAVLLLLAGCASGTGQRELVVGQVADAMSTVVALERGAQEANPLIRGGSRDETLVRLVVLKGVVTWWCSARCSPRAKRILGAVHLVVAGRNLAEVY